HSNITLARVLIPFSNRRLAVLPVWTNGTLLQILILLPCTTLFRSHRCCPGTETTLVRARLQKSHHRAPSPSPTRFRSMKREHCRSEEHTSELQSRENLVCRLLLEKKK